MNTHRLIQSAERHYDLPPGSLLTKTRKRHIAHPRQMVMYILRLTTNKSFPQIARAVGVKDHATVIHGVRAFEERALKRSELAEDAAAVVRGSL